jgi:hypothetical protein
LQKVKLYNATENVTVIGTKEKPGAMAATSKEIADFFVKNKVMKEAPTKTNLFTPDFLPTT